MPAKNILIVGAGKIGSVIANLLAKTNDYFVFLLDLPSAPPHSIQQLNSSFIHYLSLDITDKAQVENFFGNNHMVAIVSCLPYFMNTIVAKIAQEHKIHYFDLTEDHQSTLEIIKIAKNANQAFVPQCGIAPGLINIIANYLMKDYETIETVKLRCGALPIHTSHALQYAINWSIDGLINEYINPCQAILDGELTTTPALNDLEYLQLDGALYEAFNTSGGIATLAEYYQEKVKHMTYKTIRYPGHRDKMRFLLRDLQLYKDRETLKKILLNSIPTSLNDVVIVYVAVEGYEKNKNFIEKSYYKKFYSKKIDDIQYSAIQITTATSACMVIDSVLKNPQKYQGFVPQEKFNLTDLENNRFYHYLQ